MGLKRPQGCTALGHKAQSRRDGCNCLTLAPKYNHSEKKPPKDVKKIAGWIAYLNY